MNYLYILRIGEGTRKRGRKIREKHKSNKSSTAKYTFCEGQIDGDCSQKRKRRRTGRRRRRSWDQGVQNRETAVEPQHRENCSFTFMSSFIFKQKEGKTDNVELEDK